MRFTITKNQDNPIKTVERDSFLSPETLKNTSFRGHSAPGGRTAPIFLRTQLDPDMSKFDRNRIKDGWEKLCTNKQTNRQTSRHYENNGHLAVNQYSLLYWENGVAFGHCRADQLVSRDRRRGLSASQRVTYDNRGTVSVTNLLINIKNRPLLYVHAVGPITVTKFLADGNGTDNSVRLNLWVVCVCMCV